MRILKYILIFSLIITGCAKAPEKNDNEIVIWHWMVDRDKFFKQLAKEYEAQTNIKIRFELYAPSDVYSQKVRAAAQTSTLPDIFGILGDSRDIARFVKAGYIVDLTPYLEANNKEWLNQFIPIAIQTNMLKPNNQYQAPSGIYGIPLDIMTMKFIYNTRFLQEHNLTKPPETIDEFIKLTKSSKTFTSGFGEIWILNSLASVIAINIMGIDKFQDTIEGKYPYNSKEWIKVFQFFKTLADKKIINNNVVTLVNKEAERIFAMEEANITYNGSWCINVYKGMNPNLKYIAALPPRFNISNPVIIQGGAGSSFFINKQSKHIKQCINFLKWLTAKQQQLRLTKLTNNLPTNKEAIQELTPLMKSFYQGIDNSFHPNILKATEHPRILERMGKGLQQIIIGEITPEQLANELQELKQKLL